MVVFLMGVAVTVYIAEKLGKLPGGKTDRRKEHFTDEDRTMLRKTRDALTWKDDDGAERFSVIARQSRETHELVIELAKLQERQTAAMELIAAKDAQRRA